MTTNEKPKCPGCGDQLCFSELEFYPFCVPCGSELQELVDGACEGRSEVGDLERLYALPDPRYLPDSPE